MGAQTPPLILDLLGLAFWGDLGDLTMYRSHRGRMVWFSKTWPNKPPTPKQLDQRAKFSSAAANWPTIPGPQRHQYQLATRRASLPMTGYSLWVYHQLTADHLTLRTLERHTQTALFTLPGAVPLTATLDWGQGPYYVEDTLILDTPNPNATTPSLWTNGLITNNRDLTWDPQTHLATLYIELKVGSVYHRATSTPKHLTPFLPPSTHTFTDWAYLEEIDDATADITI